MEYGTGRIAEVIDALQSEYHKSILEIPAEKKLQALCEALQISKEMFDKLIANHSPVLRTVKGHAFESYFDNLMREGEFEITEIGGDNAIDRVINKIKLQLKTSTLSGTKGKKVQFKTHKTHGAKSERESLDYYHRAEHFADILVGLISYDPLKIIFLHRDELPRHAQSQEHILSPFTIEWENHPGLNDFSKIGITFDAAKISKRVQELEVLPLTFEKIGINSNVILNTILNKANFRIWDMSIRGFAREIVFIEALEARQVAHHHPSVAGKKRSDKADLALKKSGKFLLLQMKGISTNNCDFRLADPVLAIETQLTRGRVNDHATQSRLYLTTDFDFLIFGVDPPIVNLCKKMTGQKPEFRWEFYAVPTKNLAPHHTMAHRLKSLQKFTYRELQKYKIDENWMDGFEKI